MHGFAVDVDQLLAVPARQQRVEGRHDEQGEHGADRHAADDHPADLLARFGARLPLVNMETGARGFLLAGAPTVLAEFAHLCVAANWPTGTAAPLPAGQRVLAGVTTWVATTGPLLDGLSRLQRFSSLALRTDAGGTVGEIMSPNSRSGDPAPQQAMQSVVQALRGNTPGPLPVMRSLFDYLSSRPAAVTYPAQRTAQGWQLAGGSFADIRRVGSVWVAIEVPRNNPAGLYLSIFVDNELLGVGL